MRLLRNLGVADKFRLAHPSQLSLNRRKMSRQATYVIIKVFPQSPHTVIAVDEVNVADGFYSLGPGTPVLLPKEFDPTLEEINDFLTKAPRKRVVGYKMLWDGKADITGVCFPAAEALVRCLFTLGKRQYSHNEIKALLDEHYFKFLGRQSKFTGFIVLMRYRRHLVDVGIIEEVVEDAPVPQGIRDANLEGVL